MACRYSANRKRESNGRVITTQPGLLCGGARVGNFECFNAPCLWIQAACWSDGKLIPYNLQPGDLAEELGICIV